MKAILDYRELAFDAANVKNKVVFAVLRVKESSGCAICALIWVVPRVDITSRPSFSGMRGFLIFFGTLTSKMEVS